MKTLLKLLLDSTNKEYGEHVNMRKNKNEKGVTLIALIVTIVIVMLLTGVVLSSSFRDGIIDESINARDNIMEFEKSVNEDQQNLLEWIAQ